MKESTSRRLFLQKSAMATTGLALLSSGVANAFSNEIPYPGYNPYSEENTDLRTSLIGEHVYIKGILYDKSGVTPVSGAVIEVWHLSPNSGKFRHRAKLTTDNQGAYQFITDFPKREIAKTPQIFFKISHKDRISFTELALDHSGGYITSKHWEENQLLRDKLFPTMRKFLNTSIINFNLLIN